MGVQHVSPINATPSGNCLAITRVILFATVLLKDGHLSLAIGIKYQDRTYPPCFTVNIVCMRQNDLPSIGMLLRVGAKVQANWMAP